ncbi:MerR family transcriptional regulator, partial [uncultured Tateyamaria sp.]
MTKSADAFRTISEVAEWLGVQTHVLRFWESKFTQVKPVKRAGGRRYYRPADMLLLGGIRKLLHEDGLTIKGVQKILREEGMAHVADMSPALDEETDAQLDNDLVSRIADDVEMPVTQEAAPKAPARPIEVLGGAPVDPTPAPAVEEGPPPPSLTVDHVPVDDAPAPPEPEPPVFVETEGAVPVAPAP